MGYSAGNLELSILGFSDKAVASVDVTAKALRRLASAVKVINNSQLTHTGQVLEYLFAKIAKSTNSINTQNIENLAAAAKSLASISRLSNLDKMDFEKIGKGFNTLAVAIQPFLDKVREAEASLTALDGILKKSSGKKIQGLLGEGGGGGNKGKGGLSAFAKLGISLHLMRRMGRFMGDLVQAGSDYNETLNLWQVAMRNNLDVADQFVNKMQKAYGISTKTLMNAQAIFKNMVGNLGNVSDATAYALSEALVQMSVDFSSLYNVKLNEAFNKMQAMLARQVRPIRSVSGYDITENTIYELYQALGGTKTMRQLNNTEKQLLSIYAVFKQMGASGALGDMSKTLNEFANQSRMMTEYWAELKTWSGLLLKDLIDQSGMLVHINALLITTTEIVKAIAKSRGIGDDNFIEGMFETAEATNDEIDELQGKLLDFDKFRSLEGAETASPLAIDEKLLQALTGYSSKIDQAQNAAQQLANEWLIALGATKDANGELVFTEGTLDEIVDNFVGLVGLLTSIPTLLLMAKVTGKWVVAGIAAAIAYGYATNEDFRESINKLIDSLGKLLLPILDIIIDSLTPILDAVVALISPIAEVISMLDDLGILEEIIIGVVTAFAMLHWEQIKAGMIKLYKAWGGLSASIKTATISVLAFVAAYDFVSFIIDSFDGDARRVVSISAIVVGAIMAIVAAVVALKGAASWGTMLPLLLAGVGAAIAGVKGLTPKVEMYATGAGDIDGGTLFVAGEMGKTEAVYTGSNGKTNVANVKQMEQAFYNALSRYGAEDGGKIVVEAYLDGEKVYQNTTAKAKARGNIWAKA